MIFSVRSSVGSVRKMNQDCYCIPANANAPALFIVADGMGGTEGGEIASAAAVASIGSYITERYKACDDIPLLLRSAVAQGNRTVYRTAKNNNRLKDMGTTVTLALIADGIAYIAQVGDSRAYMMSNGTLTQITKDHSYVQELVDAGELTADEARQHPDRNKITRALGVYATIKVDVYLQPCESGSTLLLCTDGLTSMLDNNCITDIMQNNACQDMAQSLVAAAEIAGGTDNITVICISF